VKEKEFVGIYSKNRVEWVLTEQALYSFSMVSVALYDTLGPTASNFIISHADITCVVVENEKNLLTILESTPPCLKKSKKLGKTTKMLTQKSRQLLMTLRL
ncbi:unnamed protein product, partial [Allacma fusca]